MARIARELDLARGGLPRRRLAELESLLGEAGGAGDPQAVERKAHRAKLRVRELFNRELEVLAHAARLGKLGEDLVDRLGVRVNLLDHLVAQGDCGDLAADELGDFQALQIRRIGKHVIASLAGLGHLDVDGDGKLEVREAVLKVFGVGVTRNHVRVVEEHALDLALLGELGSIDVHTHARKGQRVLIRTCNLAFRLGDGRELLLVEVARLHGVAEEGAAFLVPAAEERVEAAHRASGLAGVCIAAAVSTTPRRLDGCCRSCRGKVGRQALDRVLRDAGDFLCPCRRAVLQVVGPLFEADGVLGDVARIVELVVHDDMCHGQDEGQVSAGVDRHPLIGERDGVVQTRVDDHQFGAVLVRLLHGMQLARLDRVGVAAADEHRHLGVRHVGGEVTRADDLGKPSVLRHVASGTVRVDVRAAKCVHETLGVI